MKSLQSEIDNVDEPGRTWPFWRDMTVRPLELRQNAMGTWLSRGQRADTLRKLVGSYLGCSGERSAHHGKGGERRHQG
ncbi:hypothetical protein [Pseudomonas aeruginosa]|uniref:hypothetical protein n=1 Tax=Pseudomonas aeruginosa TaxID=287 RepID=UPI003D6E94E1